MSINLDECEALLAAHDTIGDKTVAVENEYGEESDTGEVDTTASAALPTEEELEREETNRDAVGDAGDNDAEGDVTDVTDAEMCDLNGLGADVDRLETYLKAHHAARAPESASIVWEHFKGGGNDHSLPKLWADMEKRYKEQVPKPDVPDIDIVSNPGGWSKEYFKAQFKGKGKIQPKGKGKSQYKTKPANKYLPL